MSDAKRLEEIKARHAGCDPDDPDCDAGWLLARLERLEPVLKQVRETLVELRHIARVVASHQYGPTYFQKESHQSANKATTAIAAIDTLGGE